MPDPPLRRYLTPDELVTPEQQLEHVRGRRVENPEYVRRRAEALERAGLEPEGDADGAPAAEDMTAEDQYRAIRRG